MREVIDWIDREVERLEGKTTAAETERVPEVLRAALGIVIDCSGQFDKIGAEDKHHS